MWIRSVVSHPFWLCVPEMEFNLDLGIELMDTHPLLRAPAFMRVLDHVGLLGSALNRCFVL